MPGLSLWGSILVLLSSGVCANEASSALKYTPENVMGFTRVFSVLPSPSGQSVVFVTAYPRDTKEGKKWHYTLRLKAGTSQKTLVESDDPISGLMFVPDKTSITYLSSMDGSQGIWSVNIKNKARAKVLALKQDIEAYQWSPNGRWIAFLTRESAKVSHSGALIPVGDEVNNAKIKLFNPLTHTVERTVSSQSVNATQLGWSADSTKVVYAFQSRAGFDYTNTSKINVVDLKSNKTITIPYTENHVGAQPNFSPDGQWIAFASNVAPTSSANALLNNVVLNNQICITSTQNMTTRCLANTFNQNPLILGWNAPSDTVVVLDAFKTLGYLVYGLSIDSPQPVKVISKVDGFIEPLTIALNQSRTILGFGYEKDATPPEVYVSPVQSFHLEQVSRLNDTFKFPLGHEEVVHWNSTDGQTIEGLLLTPANYDPKQKYPLYVAVHGGPAGTWEKRFLGGCDEYGEMIDLTTCWQNILSLGFVVLAPNPRGSSGYGLNFRMANAGDFGGGDYRDVMAGVDYLVNKGVVDARKLAIGGWSYGGYLTAWTITQTDRFKAAIMGDGLSDLISFSGTSDAPHFLEEYLGGHFWDDAKLYLDRAPIMHVKDIKTPLLILHGEKDDRVPITQAYEMYNAMKRQHKPVTMVVLPGQHHVPTDANVIDHGIQAVDDWLTPVPENRN